MNLFIYETYSKNRMGSVMDIFTARRMRFNTYKRSIHAGKLSLILLLLGTAWMVIGTGVAHGQTIDGKPLPTDANKAATVAAASDLTFDVASVRPSAPLDMMKVAMDMQAGKMPNWGAHINGLLAEYNYLRLRDLIVAAYKVKDYQVTGPDWMNKADAQRFDIAVACRKGRPRTMRRRCCRRCWRTVSS